MEENMIGAYGPWAAALADGIPRLSFRRPEWTDLESWRQAARDRLMELLAQPDSGGVPEVTVEEEGIYEGLHYEKLSWQLPYGPRTEAAFLKPAGAEGPLPAILALHDHAGNKRFGKSKIARIADEVHPMMLDHAAKYYGGTFWVDAAARRGYAVMVADVFPFESRRVLLKDVPASIRNGLSVEDTDDVETIAAYNKWASGHESIMAKSLFCAGTTWPGVFLSENQRALDVLCAREDVDAGRVGCGGLSGGGMQTVYLGGTDARVKCAVCVGLMTTWRDYLLNRSHTHTWMIYVPHLARDLDFPEILGLRVPRPTMVLNNIHDSLFTMPEMERADRILAEVFEKAGAADRYQCSFYPGPHKFDPDMQEEAFAWFDRWLKVV